MPAARLKAAWIDATTPARARPASAPDAGQFFPREKRRGAEGAAGSARGRRALRLSLGAERERQDPPSARFFRGGGGRETRSRRGGRRRPSRRSGADRPVRPVQPAACFRRSARRERRGAARAARPASGSALTPRVGNRAPAARLERRGQGRRPTRARRRARHRARRTADPLPPHALRSRHGTQIAALDALDRYSLQRKRPITLPLLKEALGLLDAGKR